MTETETERTEREEGVTLSGAKGTPPDMAPFAEPALRNEGFGDTLAP